jgi:hypothetical protein
MPDLTLTPFEAEILLDRLEQLRRDTYGCSLRAPEVHEALESVRLALVGRVRDEDTITRAREQFARDGELEFDDRPAVSRLDPEDSPRGAYVASWVWVDDA